MKTVAFLVLMVVGFVGLAMTICGGGILVVILGSSTWTPGGLLLPLVSLVIGVTVLFAVWRAMKDLNDE